MMQSRHNKIFQAALPLAVSVLMCSAAAAAGEAKIDAVIDAYAPQMSRVAQAIWQKPELGYQEVATSRLLQTELRNAKFTIEAGVAGMPTAFVARAGTPGRGPVIALLAEMDALPGMSQASSPERHALVEGAAGHACGHNLFGAAAVGAAIAIRDWLQASGVPGEVRVYGAPAEEGGSGKVFLVKAGLFDDVDAVMHWHPDSINSASQGSSLANISGKFRFSGIASHASIAPERGRSALDGVEALNFMANLMREHIPSNTRLHYVITNGGGAPNVVPAQAEVYYYVRHPEHRVVSDVIKRLQLAAEGAAQGTGTQVTFEQIGGVYNLLSNDTLGRMMDRALNAEGGIKYDSADTAFALQLQRSLINPPAIETASKVAAYDREGLLGMASTDVGDVSWVVPTVGLSIATWVPGTAAHSWQAVAASGSTIGHKGAQLAAKVLANAAAELYRRPALLDEAKTELDRRRGQGFQYQSLLERVDPPLNYRVAKP